MRALIPFLLIPGLLAGCGDELLRQQANPAFATGYDDGCKNGSSMASNLTGQFIRNEARYNSEPEYARGWQNGNRACNGENLQQNPNNPMEQIDIDGPR